MKATLVFNLPEEQYEFDVATEAHTALSILSELREHIRSRLKYGEDVTEQEAAALEKVREIIAEGSGVLFDKGLL